MAAAAATAVTFGAKNRCGAATWRGVWRRGNTINNSGIIMA